MTEYIIADRSLPILLGMNMIEAAATPSIAATAFQMINKLGDDTLRKIVQC